MTTGSPNFEDGDFVETTTIAGGKIENGSTVTTATGSRYFLSAEPPTKVASKFAKVLGSSPTITLTNQRKAIEDKSEADAPPKATFSLFDIFGGGDSDDKPKAPKAAASKPKAKAAPVKKAPPASRPKAKAAPVQKSPTLSLPKIELPKPKPAAAPAKKTPPPPKRAPVVKKAAPPKKKAPPPKKAAPRGVPAISGWKANADGSVSGSISGSPNFRDGERVTTSPIVKGRYGSGEVVTTGSGSRYYLS